jgi:hypothetical protein
MKSIIIAFLLFISVNLAAQKWEKSINVNYNWTFIAQSIEGDFNLRKNHSTLSAGMQVYVATYPEFNEGVYKKAAYADTWFNHIGLNASYHFNIFRDERIVNPFLFYQTLLSHLCFHKVGDMDPFEDWRGYGVTDPYWITENNLGIGFEFQLWNKISVYQAAGGGYSWFFGSDDYIMSARGEWTYTLKVGLLYRFASSY